MTYILREKDENGRLIQEATKENPFTFICGMQQVLPKFEENLMGKEPGDHYCFYLTPAEGYGEHDENYVMDLDKKMFMQNDVLMDMVKEGAQLMMQTADGRPIMGIVREIGDKHVKMDFNHELAGKELHFTGKVTGIRDATEKELTDGLHGERAAQGCNHDCSSCGGGCGN